MTKRTCDIIKACKGVYFAEVEGQLNRVKHFMAKECQCPITVYTPHMLNVIMFDAMCDYIDSCDKPSFFLRELDRVYNKENISIAEQIAITFELVEVKDENGNYVNGFTAELLGD